MNIYDCWNCAMPAWAINALINGNVEGLTLDEIAMIAAWEDKVNKMYDDLYEIEFSIDDSEMFYCKTPEFGEPTTCLCLSVYVLEPII